MLPESTPHIGLYKTYFVTIAFQTTIVSPIFTSSCALPLFWNGDNRRSFAGFQRFQGCTARARFSLFPGHFLLQIHRNQLVVNHFISPLRNSKSARPTYLPHSCAAQSRCRFVDPVCMAYPARNHLFFVFCRHADRILRVATDDIASDPAGSARAISTSPGALDRAHHCRNAPYGSPR